MFVYYQFFMKAWQEHEHEDIRLKYPGLSWAFPGCNLPVHCVFEQEVVMMECESYD